MIGTRSCLRNRILSFFRLALLVFSTGLSTNLYAEVVKHAVIATTPNDLARTWASGRYRDALHLEKQRLQAESSLSAFSQLASISLIFEMCLIVEDKDCLDEFQNQYEELSSSDLNVDPLVARVAKNKALALRANYLRIFSDAKTYSLTAIALEREFGSDFPLDWRTTVRTQVELAYWYINQGRINESRDKTIAAFHLLLSQDRLFTGDLLSTLRDLLSLFDQLGFDGRIDYLIKISNKYVADHCSFNLYFCLDLVSALQRHTHDLGNYQVSLVLGTAVQYLLGNIQLPNQKLNRLKLDNLSLLITSCIFANEEVCEQKEKFLDEVLMVLINQVPFELDKTVESALMAVGIELLSNYVAKGIQTDNLKVFANILTEFSRRSTFSNNREFVFVADYYLATINGDLAKANNSLFEYLKYIEDVQDKKNLTYSFWNNNYKGIVRINAAVAVLVNSRTNFGYDQSRFSIRLLERLYSPFEGISQKLERGQLTAATDDNRQLVTLIHSIETESFRIERKLFSDLLKRSSGQIDSATYKNETNTNYFFQLSNFRKKQTELVKLLNSFRDLEGKAQGDKRSGLGMLESNERFLQFRLIGGTLLSSCSDSKHSSIYASSLELVQFASDLRLVNLALNDDAAPSILRDQDFPVQSAGRLFNALLLPMSACLDGADSLIISSDVELSGVPYLALPITTQLGTNSSSQSGSLASIPWVGAKYAISSISSLSSLMSIRNRGKVTANIKPTMLSVANPKLENQVIASSRNRGRNKDLQQTIEELGDLPEAELEAASLVAALKIPALQLRNFHASEEELRRINLSDFSVYHFATHSVVRGDTSVPLEASLVLRPTRRNDLLADGLLTSTDISRLVLRPSLVVLSSCNSAKTDVDIFGPEVQSLSEAFLSAGASVTLGSVKYVDSSVAQELITDFGQYFGRHRQSAAVALRGAIRRQIEGAKSPSNVWKAHPRHWSSFRVFGDPSWTLGSYTEESSAPQLINWTSSNEIYQEGFYDGDTLILLGSAKPPVLDGLSEVKSKSPIYRGIVRAVSPPDKSVFLFEDIDRFFKLIHVGHDEFTILKYSNPTHSGPWEISTHSSKDGTVLSNSHLRIGNHQIPTSHYFDSEQRILYVASVQFQFAQMHNKLILSAIDLSARNQKTFVLPTGDGAIPRIHKVNGKIYIVIIYRTESKHRQSPTLLASECPLTHESSILLFDGNSTPHFIRKLPGYSFVNSSTDSTKLLFAKTNACGAGDNEIRFFNPDREELEENFSPIHYRFLEASALRFEPRFSDNILVSQVRRKFPGSEGLRPPVDLSSDFSLEEDKLVHSGVSISLFDQSFKHMRTFYYFQTKEMFIEWTTLSGSKLTLVGSSSSFSDPSGFALSIPVKFTK